MPAPLAMTSPRDGYSAYLRAMDEPSLLAATKDRSVVAYRFLWLRSVDHPIAIRLTIHPDGTATLAGKQTSASGGYPIGGMTWNKSFNIPQPQVQSFMVDLHKAAFWQAAAKEDEPGIDATEIY